MSDDVLNEFYNSLLDEDLLKIVINAINEQSSDSDEDFEEILEICLDRLKRAE